MNTETTTSTATSTTTSTATSTATNPGPISASVSMLIGASASSLFAMITDVTRMNEWSPETIEAQWLKGATGPAVGAQFKGKNRMGKSTWSTKPTITVCNEDRVFEFKVPGASGATWRYEFEPVAGGTIVTESVQQQKRSPFPIRILQRRAGVTDRNTNLRDAMTTTLQRLALASAA
jgi:Polyketide cyclase / dehydrase and lipid transport